MTLRLQRLGQLVPCVTLHGVEVSHSPLVLYCSCSRQGSTRQYSLMIVPSDEAFQMRESEQTGSMRTVTGRIRYLKPNHI